MAIDHLSRLVLSAKRHRVADRGQSGAIEHPTDTELRLPAEQSQREVAAPLAIWQSPPIEPVNLIQTHHPRDVGPDIVRHGGTLTNDHVAFVL